MIFARRALQRRLDELRTSLGNEVADGLAARLNTPGSDCMAAMWEAVVLHGLSRHGHLTNEQPIPSGKRPDILFNNDQITFVADVTTVSNDGLDEANPYYELSQQIEAAKTKLGMPIGGVDLRVGSRREPVKGGTRTRLTIPPKPRIRSFVEAEIVPLLRAHIQSGDDVFRVAIDDGQIDIQVTIDPARGSFSSGSYAAYDRPASLTVNPLWNALRKKAEQLRSAEHLKGIFVCDGGCVCTAVTNQANGLSAVGR